MSDLARWNGSPAERELARQLARQTGNMELAVAVAKAGMTGIGEVNRYAAEKVATTLKAADHIVKAASSAGTLTPDKKTKLRRQTQTYLNEMLHNAEDGGSEIINVLLGT